MESLFEVLPSWVCYIGVFFLGYGVCRLLNIEHIEEGRRVKKAEDDRLTAFIAEVKAEHARHDAEHEAKLKECVQEDTYVER